ncbi:MAG: hypothetical protein LBC99_03050 [Spirochaetota bacterium]|jgi:hypothetical protein|nr:hypothetical protein [Spirochaetota bacterium]
MTTTLKIYPCLVLMALLLNCGTKASAPANFGEFPADLHITLPKDTQISLRELLNGSRFRTQIAQTGAPITVLLESSSGKEKYFTTNFSYSTEDSLTKETIKKKIQIIFYIVTGREGNESITISAIRIVDPKTGEENSLGEHSAAATMIKQISPLFNDETCRAFYNAIN